MGRTASFYKFMIMNFLEEDSPLGDLARDMKSDRDFPKSAISHDRILDHLERCAACSDCFDAFEESWNRYLLWKEADNA